jgi:hypothetical protein
VPDRPACNQLIATTCNADGSGYLAGGVDCATSGQICAAGACTDLLCAPSTRYCDLGTVRQCSADGLSSTLYATCTATQYCDGATATCLAQVCSPNQPWCNGNVATTCNDDGSGYLTTGGTDCSTVSRVCVAGGCQDLVCVPNSRYCDSGTVRQCSTDGSSSTLYQTCSAAQYCDTATATCQNRVCTPNQPTCRGDSVTMCNADGSGYVGAETPCGTLTCVNGVCQSSLFFESFEDGDYVGWLDAGGTYTRSVTNATAAAGTTFSLVQTSSGTASHQTGLYHTFTNIQPTHIGWWVMATQTSVPSGYFILTSGSTSSYWGYVYFNGSSMIRLSGVTETASYTANTWYHMEYRNINWTTRTFDFYVNDAPIYTNQPFYSTTLTYIDRLDLYNFGATTAYWDEIVFD